jgi:hypothetical protein
MTAPGAVPDAYLPDVVTDILDPTVSAPAWAIARVDAMVGFTHEEVGELQVDLQRSTGGSPDRAVRLRDGENWGEANNFTSYDLLQSPAGGGDWFVPADFVGSGHGWTLFAYDWDFGNFEGQTEYLQVQVTVRTYANRADTDADGLNDSEELNLGFDCFATDPWIRCPLLDAFNSPMDHRSPP